MIKKLFATAVLVAVSAGTAYSQDTLDTERYKNAEIFTVKKDYDVQRRIQEIEDIKGKEVTVYEVSGKKNRIKLTYTGVVEIIKPSKLSDKGRATVLTVVTKDTNGRTAAYFPLTNSNNYRIYLTDKMK